MKIPLKILIVEDSESDAGLNVRALEAAGYKVSYELAANAGEMKSALDKHTSDLVISDHNMPQFDSHQSLALLRESGQDIPFIVVSGTIGEETAVALMKAGAQDYVMKGNLSRLAPAVERALREVEDQRARKRAENALRVSEEAYRMVVENANEAIFVAQDGMFKFTNHRTAMLTGYSMEALASIRFASLIHPDDREFVIERHMRRLKGEELPSVYPFRVMDNEGKTKWVEISAIVISWNGKPATLNFAADITERKEGEAQLKRAYADLKEAIDGAVLLMASTVEVRDPYTAGHQKKVAKIAEAIALEMKLSKERIQGIHMAGLIHDLGKIAVPAEILSKPGKLSDLEFEIIKTHSKIGYDLLNPIHFPWPLAQIVFQHHEWMDGSGYPSGISGDEILLEARIIAVADVVEAMSAHRPYRASLGIEKALEEIEGKKGKLYDPQVADACLRLFREKGFTF
jgi:PAS domain S-box-containing protein